MKYFSILFAIAAVTLFSGCGEQIKGNGNIVEVTHSLDAFDRVDIEGMFTVELVKGGSEIEVITDENLHEFIHVEVDNGELRIDTEDKYLDSKTLVLRVHYDEISEIDVSGAIELSCAEALSGESFSLEVSGACDAELELDVQELNIEIAGGGELRLSGTASDASFKISGAGDIKAAELRTDATEIKIAGAGEIEIDAKDRLNVDITGAGDVRYIGDPEISQSITGAGSVEKI